MICAFGEFELDAALFELRRSGQRVAVEPKVFDLLSHLVLHAERVVTRDEIFAALWPNEFVSDAALSYAVRAARKAIADDGRHQRFIRTVHRRGFRFVGNVVRRDEAATASSDSRPAPRIVSGAPFVGRELELAELVAASGNAAAGRGSLFLLSGEPGIGKTRLVRELAEDAARRSLRILTGRCYEGDGAPAFAPWMEALGSFVRTERESELRAALGDSAGDVAALVPEVRERFPHLPSPPSMDPERARFRLFDSVARFLGRAAANAPIVLVLDDLHWADFSSLLLLQFVAREIANHRLLVIGTHRDLLLARNHPLAQTLGNLARVEAYRRMSLNGLSPAEVRAFVRGASGVEPSDSVVASIHRETDGNPFFVTELVRLLDAPAQLQSSAAQLAIPPTVREAIIARIGAVSENCAGALEAAAVIGREFDVPVLAAVLRGESGTAVRDLVLGAIDEAVAVRLIEPIGGDRTLVRLRRYRFVHSLVREVVYDTLGGGRQALLHGLVGDAIEEIGARDPARQAELAHHFANAGEIHGAKAIAYSVAAAEQATATMAYEEAGAHYDRALSLLGVAGGNDRQRCELLLAMAWSHWQANDGARARPIAREAAALARALGSSDLLARAALSYGDAFRGFEMGVYDHELVELLEAALAAVGDQESELRARVLARLAVALYHAEGSDGRRETLSLQAVKASRRVRDAGAQLATLYSRHWAIWGPDSLDSRLSAATEMVLLADRVGDAEMSFHAHRFRFMDLLEEGSVEPLEHELQLCEDLAGRLGQPYYRWYVDTFHALRAFLEGRFADCERLAHVAAEVGQRAQNQNVTQILGIQIFAVRREQGRLGELTDAIRGFIDSFPKIPGWRAALAIACAESGQMDRARAEFEHVAADDFSVFPRDAFWLANLAALADVCAFLGDTEPAAVLYRLLAPFASSNVALAPGAACNGSVGRVLGRLSATMGRWDQARRHFEQALAMNLRLGAPQFVAHTQTQYAEMLLARSRAADRERAARLLQEACATYDRLAMPAAEKTAAALRLRAESTVPRRAAQVTA